MQAASADVVPWGGTAEEKVAVRPARQSASANTVCGVLATQAQLVELDLEVSAVIVLAPDNFSCRLT